MLSEENAPGIVASIAGLLPKPLLDMGCSHNSQRMRSGQGVKFNSAIVPPYIRKSAKVSAALPWLYLKGALTLTMTPTKGR